MSGDYDLIVIGSGMGGLTVASLATQLMGKRVLVLERHWRIGGFTHAFARKQWSWDVGLHYVGGIAPGGAARPFFDLVTGGMGWERLPDRYDKLHLPDGEFAFASDEAVQQRELAARFPHEVDAIARYYRDLDLVRRQLGIALYAASMPAPLRWGVNLWTTRARRLARMTTAAYLDRRFGDPALKRLLACRWPDFGLAPDDSAFGVHAMVLGSYAGGAGRPAGGASAIAEHVKRIVDQGGGELLASHEVTSILVEEGQAEGVEVVRKNRERLTFRAPLIVSDAGAWTTYRRLLPDAFCPSTLARQLNALRPRSTAVTLYLGLTGDPAQVGLTGENHWLVGEDANRASTVELDAIAHGEAPILFVSSDHGDTAAGRLPTVQVMVPVAADAFAPWGDTRWQHRDADYTALKGQLIEGLLARLERNFPGIGALIGHAELSTPLTVSAMTGHERGAIYGLAVTPDRFAKPLDCRTPVKGLYMSGADMCTPGIQGALMGGVFATASMIGLKSMPIIVKAASRAANHEQREVAAAFLAAPEQVLA